MPRYDVAHHPLGVILGRRLVNGHTARLTVVTPRIEHHVRQHFDDPAAVLARLAGWRISYREEPPSERLTAAVVLAADGRRAGVDAALRLAEQDWRDLLVAGGLAHGDWPAVLDSRLGPSRD
jgi:hypothetical protein